MLRETCGTGWGQFSLTEQRPFCGESKVFFNTRDYKNEG